MSVFDVLRCEHVKPDDCELSKNKARVTHYKREVNSECDAFFKMTSKASKLAA